MLTPDEMHDPILSIAREHLGRKVHDVRIESDFDFEGHPSLRITVILKTGWGKRVPGRALGDISLGILDYLAEIKDERFPYTHYATVKELEELAEADD